jgi:hydroxyacylglutathione hydrolase
MAIRPAISLFIFRRSRLSKLRNLPDDTLIYCGHEYTENNAKFALAIDKNNTALQAHAKQAADLRKEGKPTLPSLMATEKQTNPFLRVDQKEFHQALAKSGLALQGTDPAAIFGTLRAAKDRFGTSS